MGIGGFEREQFVKHSHFADRRNAFGAEADKDTVVERHIEGKSFVADLFGIAETVDHCRAFCGEQGKFMASRVVAVKADAAVREQIFGERQVHGAKRGLAERPRSFPRNVKVKVAFLFRESLQLFGALGQVRGPEAVFFGSGCEQPALTVRTQGVDCVGPERPPDAAVA